MAKQVVMGAKLNCPAGSAPSNLIVLPRSTMCGGKPAANIMDKNPFANILPFGTCQILTSAALGVPTPCVPAIAAPWSPGSSTVKVDGMPALIDSDTCICTIGGSITITDAGQTDVETA